jgi:hypothetical protein
VGTQCEEGDNESARSFGNESGKGPGIEISEGPSSIFDWVEIRPGT